jgi:capsular polysaccharide biosynthesis protein
MIKELDLIARWHATRQPAVRFKDAITSIGAAKRTDEEQMRDMIELLQKRLSVATDESSITIAIQWPDKQIEFEIVSFLQKNFLEARYDSNVNVIVEAIHILEERAKPQAAEVDAALAELTKVENERRQSLVGSGTAFPAAETRPRGGRVFRAVAGAGAGSPQPTAGADADMARQLEDVRSRIRSITQERDRQLMEAHQQLADARATLGPMHPTVVALNDKIAQLEAPPSELHALEERERQLVAALAAPAAASPAPSPAPMAAPTPFTAPVVTATPAPASSTAPTIAELLRDDPEVALARSRLQAASAKYNELLSRIEAANIELEVTRAAFKYQYTVVRPPEIARKPSKPNVPLVMIATLLAAPLLAMLFAGIRDLLRGRFVEPWQVERHLNLPLLGELNPPP